MHDIIPYMFFLKKWAIPGIFFVYFRLFNTVDNKHMFNIYFLPMTGFKPRTSSIRATAIPTEPHRCHQYSIHVCLTDPVVNLLLLKSSVAFPMKCLAACLFLSAVSFPFEGLFNDFRNYLQNYAEHLGASLD